VHLSTSPVKREEAKGSCEAPAYAAPNWEERKNSQTRGLALHHAPRHVLVPATMQPAPALTVTLQALLLSCSDRKDDGSRAQETLGSRFRAQLLPPGCSQLQPQHDPAEMCCAVLQPLLLTAGAAHAVHGAPPPVAAGAGSAQAGAAAASSSSSSSCGLCVVFIVPRMTNACTPQLQRTHQFLQ